MIGSETLSHDNPPSTLGVSLIFGWAQGYCYAGSENRGPKARSISAQANGLGIETASSSWGIKPTIKQQENAARDHLNLSLW